MGKPLEKKSPHSGNRLLLSASLLALLWPAFGKPATPVAAEEVGTEVAISQSSEQSESSNSQTNTVASIIDGEQIREISDPRDGFGYENMGEVETDMAVSIVSSSETPEMQSYSIRFSSQFVLRSSSRQQAYIVDDDPTFNDVQAQTDENGDYIYPEYNGAVYSLEIAENGRYAGETDLYIPAILTRQGYYRFIVSSIYADAIDPEDAPNVTSVYIPTEIESAGVGALGGLSEDCQIYFEASAVPENFEEGWTNLPESNFHFNTEIEERYRAQNVAYNRQIGTGESFITGYDLGEGKKDERQLLNITYDAKDSSGNVKTYNRDVPLNFGSVAIYYNGVTNAAPSFTRNIDIPKEEDEEIIDTSIVIGNIYKSIRTQSDEYGVLYEPDYETGALYCPAKISYTTKFSINDFGTMEYNFSSSFAGYSLISLKMDLRPDVYSSLNHASYEAERDDIESGLSYVRFRLAGLNSSIYHVTYEDNGELVESAFTIETPLANFVIDDGESIGFIVKNSDVGPSFSVPKLRSFGIESLLFTVDIMNNDTHQAVGHSAVSTRFGYLNLTEDASAFAHNDLNWTLTIIAIIYSAMMFAAIAVTFIYKKIRYKNDEFRRLNVSSFVKNAILFYLITGIIVFFIAFATIRWTSFDNAIVVYNPLDPFVIVFGILAILAVGYYIRFFYVSIKSEIARRKAIKLKLDSDLDDDGTK